MCMLRLFDNVFRSGALLPCFLSVADARAILISAGPGAGTSVNRPGMRLQLRAALRPVM